jgi:hypothetical protein
MTGSDDTEFTDLLPDGYRSSRRCYLVTLHCVPVWIRHPIGGSNERQ